MRPNFTKMVASCSMPHFPQHARFPSASVQSIPATLRSWAAKGDRSKMTISHADASCSSHAMNPNVMQDEQSAGTEKKHVSQKRESSKHPL